MVYILIYFIVGTNPSFLGDYNSKDACNNAREEISQMSSYPIGTIEQMKCIPKGLK